MYIKKIEIGKYKKLNNLKIEFGQLNVIIGKNNSGKTTLLNVLKSFFDKDAKIFKGYQNPNNEDIGIKITTNTSEWKLDTTKATPKWTKVFDDVEDEAVEFNYGYLSAHTTPDEILKTIQSGAAGFVRSGNERIVPNIDALLRSYELSSDLDGSETIAEENDDYGLSFKFDLSKAISVSFSNSANSIINKGLGQQKEFVLRQFSGENPFSVDILLIDEVENSLSEEALVEILVSLKREDVIDECITFPGEDELQVIVTTHNRNSISPEILPNIIILGNEIPTGILRNLGNEIFVEGPSDSKVLSSIYPGHFFIPGGGSNLPKTVEAVVNQGGVPKVIVDGDVAGLEYELKINRFMTTPIKALSHGTIEDYHLETEIVSILDSKGIAHSNPLPRNILQALTFPGSTKEKVKELIQMKSIDEPKLRAELDAYINL